MTFTMVHENTVPFPFLFSGSLTQFDFYPELLTLLNVSLAKVATSAQVVVKENLIRFPKLKFCLSFIF